MGPDISIEIIYFDVCLSHYAPAKCMEYILFQVFYLLPHLYIMITISFKELSVDRV